MNFESARIGTIINKKSCMMITFYKRWLLNTSLPVEYCEHSPIEGEYVMRHVSTKVVFHKLPGLRK